jgi:hypothetical protein
MVDVLIAIHWVCPSFSSKLFDTIETGPSATVSRRPLGCDHNVNHSYLTEIVGLPTMNGLLLERKNVGLGLLSRTQQAEIDSLTL